MSALEAAGAVVVVLAAVGTLVGLIFKVRPETGRIFVESAKVTVEIADEARDNLREDVAALRAELAERKREEVQYRSDVEMRLAELSAQLRAEKAEKEHVKRENTQLRKRVKALEDEVRSLKANG